MTASRAHFGARLNRHIRSGSLIEARHDYRTARLYSMAIGLLAAAAVMMLIWGVTWIPDGPFASFTDTGLLMLLFALVSVFRLSMTVFGPVQMIAILLGADRYVRNLNLVMLGFLATGLTLAGMLDRIWLPAVVIVACTVSF